MYRVLTVAREYGSGGASIAALVAERLGWRLLDSALIDEIARAAHVDPELARQYDERVDTWLHRLSRRGLWFGAFEGVAPIKTTEVFDAETMALLTRTVVGQACEMGSCVVVGRGGQCILQECADAFHVFVYAPWEQKVARVKQRLGSGADVPAAMRAMDEERARYVRMNFGGDWADPHLYDLLISSKPGDEATASVIIAAMGGGQMGTT
jgi:cytidylate kinase